MIDKNVLLDLESDRVERSVSTTNTDKFGQAICAFANDLVDHRKSEYLILGADDDGYVQLINITDELLKNMAILPDKAQENPESGLY